MTVSRPSVTLYLLLLAYLLLLLSFLLPEANWHLQGVAFSTQLGSQWSGYALMVLAFGSALVHAAVYHRRRYIALGPSLFAGGYCFGFALVKWFRLHRLSLDFQSVETAIPASVTIGSGLYLLAIAGLLLLFLGFWSWFGPNRRSRSTT